MGEDDDVSADPEQPHDAPGEGPKMFVLPQGVGKRAQAIGALTPPHLAAAEPATGSTNGPEPDPHRAVQGHQGVPPLIVPLYEFAEEQEEYPPPILGAGDEMVLPEGGLLLMYGDGGAGKTTLTLDALAHLASGTSWLGIDVPRPFKILLIENEGPRGMLRKRLQEKRDWWIAQGRPAYGDNVGVWQDPWHSFDFNLVEHREAVAGYVDQYEADLVMIGPLATLGTIGGGTPDEVNTFVGLLKQCWSLTPRPFGFWFLHHENKAGDVSGAWERVPDTLVHVRAQGHGHTSVHWQKVRWSSELQGTTTNLTWVPEGYTYTVDAKKAERDLRAECGVVFEQESERWWTAAEMAKELGGVGRPTVKVALDEMVEAGTLVFVVGPPGRNATAQCYRLNDGWQDTLQVNSDAEFTRVHPSSPEATGAEGRAGEPVPPTTEGGGTVEFTSPDPDDAGGEPDPSTTGSPEEDDGIPW